MKKEKTTNTKPEKKKKSSKAKKLSEDSIVKSIVFYTPSRIKKVMASYEVPVTKQVPFFCYLLCVLSALLLSFMFNLNWQYWIITVVAGIFFAPIILVEIIKEKNEHQRFSDVNSYAQQFIGGMQLKHRILPAIENTVFTFPSGKMNETLNNALKYIYTAKDQIKAQSDALLYIDNIYPNSQTPMIHDFAKRIEATGGNFENEMNLLNTKREKWEKRIEHEQQQPKVTIYGSIFMYIVMTLICAFVNTSLPESLSVMHYPFVQIAETLVIMFFYPFVFICMRAYRKGWMNKEESMDESTARQKLDFVNNFDPRVQRKKGLICGFISLIGFGIWCFISKNVYIAFIGIIATAVAFNIHHLQYTITMRSIRKEMSRCVPKWLFDVCLCMQKTNIIESIERSKRTAAPILKDEIELFLSKLRENPSDVTPYIEFLLPYGVPNINATMRALLSIQNGTGGDVNMQMQQLISHNLNLLDEQDAAEEEVRRLGALKYQTFSTIPASLVMFVYLFAIIVKVFDMMKIMV